MCGLVPSPGEPKVSLASPFASAISSGNVWTPRVARTISALFTEPASTIGSNAVAGSYGRLGCSDGLITILPEGLNNSVRPSGAAFATVFIPTMPPAPPTVDDDAVGAPQFGPTVGDD